MKKFQLLTIFAFVLSLSVFQAPSLMAGEHGGSPLEGDGKEHGGETAKEHDGKAKGHDKEKSGKEHGHDKEKDGKEHGGETAKEHDGKAHGHDKDDKEHGGDEL